MDGTLIKVKSGKKFPKDKDDWIFYDEKVKEKLKEYYEMDYAIVIFTN